MERIKAKLGPQQGFVTAGGFEGNQRGKAMFVTMHYLAMLKNQIPGSGYMSSIQQAQRS